MRTCNLKSFLLIAQRAGNCLHAHTWAMVVKARNNLTVWNWLQNSGGSSKGRAWQPRGLSADAPWPLRTQQLTWFPTLFYSIPYVQSKGMPHPLWGRGFKPRYPNYSSWIKVRSYVVKRSLAIRNAQRPHRLSSARRLDLVYCSVALDLWRQSRWAVKQWRSLLREGQRSSGSCCGVQSFPVDDKLFFILISLSYL